jgi:hypothetical protein
LIDLTPTYSGDMETMPGSLNAMRLAIIKAGYATAGITCLSAGIRSMRHLKAD